MGKPNTAPYTSKESAQTFLKSMIRMRVLEERMIKMAKSRDAYFWIGGPGEEAFNIALAHQINCGQGIAHDFLHLHYRNSGVLMTLGLKMIDIMRQLRCTASDSLSGGRNMVTFIAKREWNLAPIRYTVGVQYVIAPGTARAQWRAHKAGQASGITVVVGGDAGTAEGDFASGLLWASRPGEELPILFIVTNNEAGISTQHQTQQSTGQITSRAKAFGLNTIEVNGIDPEDAYKGLEAGFDYVREQRKPCLLEVKVSRMYGHSSSSGANLEVNQPCPIEHFTTQLLNKNWVSQSEVDQWTEDARCEANEALDIIREEPLASGDTIHDHAFIDGSASGLPGLDISKQGFQS